MAIFNKASNEEIEHLCNNVYTHLADSSYNSESDLISRLRLICGKSECGCKILTPSQNLSYLLRAQENTKTLDLSVGLSIIHNYTRLAHENSWQTVLERILRLTLTDSSSVVSQQFFDQLWNFNGFRFFTISLVEEFLLSKTNYIEGDVFELLKKYLLNLNHSNIWMEEKFDRLVYWSTCSARIFCTVTSVLNSWLQRIVSATGHYETCVSVVVDFIIRVRSKCTEHKKDFVFLYPAEFHSLVSLLDINPRIFPQHVASVGSMTLSSVVTLVHQSLQTKPVQTLCLLTHFPEWSSFIDR